MSCYFERYFPAYVYGVPDVAITAKTHPFAELSGLLSPVSRRDAIAGFPALAADMVKLLHCVLFDHSPLYVPKLFRKINDLMQISYPVTCRPAANKLNINVNNKALLVYVFVGFTDLVLYSLFGQFGRIY